MALEFSIRPFIPSDSPAVMDVHQRAILNVPTRFYGRAERESWAHGMTATAYAKSAANRDTFIVAETPDDTLVGFCGYRVTEAAGVVCDLFTTPEQQRRGVGQALLATAEQSLCEQRVQSVTVKSSLASVSFYEAQGYFVTLRTRHMTRGGLEIEIRHMEKPV